MSGPALLSVIRDDGVATLTLNRPERHNAVDDSLIAALDEALTTLEAQPAVRAVVLRGAGPSFSAGADLDWMRRSAGYSDAENLADAEALAGMLRRLDQIPKPTIAEIQGPAIGGGVGLVAACDIAVAADGATFALSEVKLGLTPATISPYVVRAIGARAARRYVLTAERLSALEAHRLGLVHEVVPGHMLTAAVARVLDRLAAGGPEAQAAAKSLIADVTGRPIDDALGRDTARRIADRRASAEGREGIAAFLDKRPPAWRRAPDD